ncbi:c-type cytochrome [Xanthobacter tagetidis]|uniref:Cytochrome c domain-containing protein n=1 Tax=Xanthobacter tagetidis TaxID=60216 RepID=A0A3L7A0U3_9HYPH|nr:c-type cytochrome [Xanthobacter tagetidis]MBB6307105.1 cytochrome c553 [Xanthobacter tagetidis]RLP73251.1 hypothetical protein D9R14_20640 [Xanthobacter tagetidis]
MNPRPARALLARAVRSRTALSAFLAPLLIGPAGASASGDREYGAYLASQCVTCHQASGATVAGVPAIVAWPEEQFVAVLDSYRKKERDNEVMRTIAATLSEEEMAALAAYFGSLKPASGH